MKILVLIGNVPDTTTKIKFNADKTAFDASGVQWIINPWDELALTRAMELKEANGGKVERIVVANVGRAITEGTLRKHSQWVLMKLSVLMLILSMHFM